MQTCNKRAEPHTAVAHLLRHLRDPSALRENPIAAPYFSAGAAANSEEIEAEALTRVHAFLIAAVERVFVASGGAAAAEHAVRQRAIIEHCDLHGKPHAAVAASLGLSRRQFYRERHHARKLLAQYFARISTHGSTQSMPSEFDLGLGFAESLSRLGRRKNAVAAIKRLRARAPAAAERIRANVALAAVYSDAGKLDAASDVLRRARSISSLESVAADDVQLLGLEIDAAMARVLWLSGRLREMKSVQERILAQLQLQGLLRTERAFELEAQSWMRLGMLSRDVGDARESLTFLRRAAGVLQSLPKPPPSLRAELAANFGLTEMVLPNGLTAAVESMRAYLSVSREHNLLCDTADALANLATLHLQSGDVARSRMFARSALDLARHVSSRQQHAEISVIAALAEAEGRNFSVSLELIERARTDFVEGSFGWALAGLAEAQALLYSGAFARAQRIATKAASSMSAIGMTRYCGAALRIAAEAAEGANRRDEAARTIREAIALLETRGHAASLARAYECRARLTHKRRDALRARELRESLRQTLAT